MGDFADVPVPGTYRLIFVVFNTLFNMLTQEDQVRCFENAAAHLVDDGSFVVEAFVPAYLLFDTLKGQLSLEEHGGRTLSGVYARVAARLLAMAAAIWHNWKTKATTKRSLIAYDH